jgi:hypothetical protein
MQSISGWGTGACGLPHPKIRLAALANFRPPHKGEVEDWA